MKIDNPHFGPNFESVKRIQNVERRLWSTFDKDFWRHFKLNSCGGEWLLRHSCQTTSRDKVFGILEKWSILIQTPRQRAQQRAKRAGRRRTKSMCSYETGMLGTER
ncbi:hypothetical protein D8B26_005563 [Coccidioides posadasii str. Silveira]|uniref:Uncharacterized protein n=1 Tax=Coccidioides posadasii RMSCC 3488 TaxID=454284 RepID=A0A0J6FSI9_COCPO|nr:hypothetical protein CPAG_08679 [Coccidioides posadasii RMSCC 3488]QVM10910.1 hypothetical protein D8B26_005563 [Coccidioides posadasii str. Silveira]